MRRIVIVLLSVAALTGMLWLLDAPSVAQTESTSEPDEKPATQEQSNGAGQDTKEAAEEGETREDRPTESLKAFVPSEKLPAGSSVSFPVDI